MQGDTRRDLVQNEVFAPARVPARGELDRCRQVLQRRQNACPSRA
jgi:hypothetical protein